jgi:hypothetical protein
MKDFSKPWEAIKHVGGKALKWAAYGAVALAALSIIVPITPLAGLVGTVGGWLGMGSTAGATTAVLTKVMTFGAVTGGIMGAAAGVGGLSGALDDAAADHVAMYEQNKVAQQRESLMRGRAQAMGAGSVSPGASMGRAQGQSLGM